MWLWNAFRVVKIQLLRLRERQIINDNPRGLEKNSASLGDIAENFYMLPIAWEPGPQSSPKLESLIDASLTEIPVRIILEFLSQSNRLESPAYQWLGTHSTIKVPQKVPFSLQKPVEDNLREVISTQLPKLRSEANKTKLAWISYSIRRSLDLWRRLDPARIPSVIIDLLNWQDSPDELHYMLDNHDVLKCLWDCFPTTLFEGPEMGEEDAFSALWRLASSGHCPSTREYLELRHGGVAPQMRTLASIESLLNRLVLTQTPFHSHTHSIIALLKARILAEQLTLRHFSKAEKLMVFEHHLLPTKTAIPLSDGSYSERGRVAEAVLVAVAEYLERCAGTGSLPYKAAETLHKMTRRDSRPLTQIHPTRVHPTHQLRLANAILRIYYARDSVPLRKQILDCKLWKIYAEGSKTPKEVKARLARGDCSDESWPWLDNLDARRTIKNAFSIYGRDSARTGDVYHPLVRTILQGIDCWHPEADTNLRDDPLRSDDHGQDGEWTEEKATSDT
ncbi:hypothetical protein C8R47DRAFT_1147789 [Mycena vitilis]|nr:hypothetical protein C8R47DRAFT_1147789 [Mycena vitilis]